jgi:nucleotide-binding universal stress UspA family protein
MRILLAIDGSERSGLASDLVASIRWPEGSTVRAVTALASSGLQVGPPWAPPIVGTESDALGSALRHEAQLLLEQTARMLARTGAKVEDELLDGRAASSILDVAGTWDADVVVMGSRGHGGILSMLLGSVAAEVVDHAPCPVLIARRPQLTRVVLAHDGSPYASVAEKLLTTWPIFAKVAVEVASVSQAATVWRSGLTPGVAAEAIEQLGASEASLREHTQIAEEATQRLRAAGLRASHVVVEGQPAAGIIGVAEDSQADLIVLGTHGRTGLTRALLGSVARNVMLHASCSVLIVRSIERKSQG